MDEYTVDELGKIQDLITSGIREAKTHSKKITANLEKRIQTVEIRQKVKSQR